MQIQLNNLIPISLKEMALRRTSAIWGKEVVFTSTHRTKIKASSGTGKTTLIHLLYRLRHDYMGTIAINGTNLKKIDSEALAILRQQKISIIFQDLRLFHQLTARENIQLNCLLKPSSFAANRIDEMADVLHVKHILDQPAGLCSYGEQQRIAILRALVQPFELLIMDEPFSHLDKENTKKAAALIQSECDARHAGFILTDLDEDENFSYTQKMNL